MASPLAAHRFLACLAQAADGVRARLLEVYVRYGLNASGFDLLTAVAAHGDTGCSQTEIAATLKMAESSVCTLIDRLQGEGLLHRFRSKHDRRRSLVLLTSAGRTRWQEITAAAEAALQRWLAAATDEELERLSRWLEARQGESAAAVADAASAAAPFTPRIREAG